MSDTRGIKLLNGINDTHGTWQGHRIDFKQPPEKMAREVVGRMDGQMPKQSEASIENGQMEARLARSNEYHRMLLEDLNYEEGEPEEDITAKNFAAARTQAAMQQRPVKSTIPYRDRGGNGKICEAIKEHFDILEYAQSRGLQFKEKHGQFQCEEMDSLWVDPVKNVFVRHSRGVGGSVIDLVMHLDELSERDAISKLRQEMSGTSASYSPEKYKGFKEKQVRKVFALPPRVEGKYSRVFSYLIKTRHIDKDIVTDLVKSHLVYEEAKYHNCVFVARDYDGTAKSATLRATGLKRFAGEVEGGQKLGWMVSPNQRMLFICEAPIDAMSIMTMMKMGQKDYQKYSYYAESGNPQHGMLRYHLEHNPNIKKVFLCHDSDGPGNALAERARAELLEVGFTGEIVRKMPKTKDFNSDLEQLVTHNQLLVQQQTEKITEEVLCITP